jgi:hypothetical protein
MSENDGIMSKMRARAEEFASATLHGPLPHETGLLACVDRAYLLAEVDHFRKIAADALGDAKRKETALRNVRRVALQMKLKLVRDADLTELLDYITSVPDHLLRFCKDAGVEAQILREVPTERATALVTSEWRLCPSHVICRNCHADRVEGRLREDLSAVEFRCQECGVTSEWTGTNA